MTKETREPCAFCPETADITGEHVWSAWAGKMFGERRYTFTRKEPDGRVLTWHKKQLSPKTKVVCRACNGGWMSELENRVKSIAGDMVYKCSPATLQDTDIATIAAWAYTKAIVAEQQKTILYICRTSTISPDAFYSEWSSNVVCELAGSTRAF